MELTILMPCLNEAETLGVCIMKAKRFLDEYNIDGEILVADNGSTDDSVRIADLAGARCVMVAEKGYGAALIGGCENAKGKYIIMGDADDSYDFSNLMPFLGKLREGFDLVMGNRFDGGIERGAMPWSHQYIGNPVLSFIGRLFYKSKIKDFHCGLRGYNKDSIKRLNLHTKGMEYASEMVVMSELNHYKIAEVPTTLKKDGRSRPPHLRSFRDGWRHLKFLFIFSPNWLFLYPGLFMILIGLILGLALVARQFTVQNVTFSIHTLLFCSAFIMIGVNTILLFLIMKSFLYYDGKIKVFDDIWVKKFNEDALIFGGGGVILAGIIVSIISLLIWGEYGFGDLVPEYMMRIVIPSVTMLEIGIMSIFSGFIIGALRSRNGEEGEIS